MDRVVRELTNKVLRDPSPENVLRLARHYERLGVRDDTPYHVYVAVEERYSSRRRNARLIDRELRFASHSLESVLAVAAVTAYRWARDYGALRDHEAYRELLEAGEYRQLLDDMEEELGGRVRWVIEAVFNADMVDDPLLEG